jgi:8-oxo-dGTP pyrophosphatase MutT (NUDIX family)
MENITDDDIKSLSWRPEDKKEVFTCPIFSIAEQYSTSPLGEKSKFLLMESNPWAIVIPRIVKDGENYFVMVKQWRHGATVISLEFPGGVIEKDEEPVAGAIRELLEETGRKAGKMTHLASVSPNPAIHTNTLHIYLADALSDAGKQNLDECEFVNTAVIRESEVIANMGKPPYIHAFMAAALFFYSHFK